MTIALSKLALLASILAGEAPGPCTPLDQAQVAYVWEARGESVEGWFATATPTAQDWAVAATYTLWPNMTDEAGYMTNAASIPLMPFLTRMTWRSTTPKCDLQAWRGQ